MNFIHYLFFFYLSHKFFCLKKNIKIFYLSIPLFNAFYQLKEMEQ